MKKKSLISLTTIALLFFSGDISSYVSADSISITDDPKINQINFVIPKPFVDQPVYEGDTLISGMGSKIGNEIVVTNIGGAVIGAGTVGLDLRFTVAILPQSAYSELYVVETDGTYTSNPTEIIVHEAHVTLK